MKLKVKQVRTGIRPISIGKVEVVLGSKRGINIQKLLYIPHRLTINENAELKGAMVKTILGLLENNQTPNTHGNTKPSKLLTCPPFNLH